MPAKERQNAPRDEQIYTGRKGTNMQRLTTQEFTSESKTQTEKVHLVLSQISDSILDLHRLH